jgi:hypothetical protein
MLEGMAMPTRSGTASRPSARMRAVSIQRIWWLVATLAALITGVLLFVSGYDGYGALALAVAASAAINLT